MTENEKAVWSNILKPCYLCYSNPLHWEAARVVKRLDKYPPKEGELVGFVFPSNRANGCESCDWCHRVSEMPGWSEWEPF